MAEPQRSFDQVDLTGATFRKVQLNDARFQMVDLSGAIFRDLSLSGASIDGAELDGLRIDGVEIALLIEAELVRREPARALRRATDPAGLQAAWQAIQNAWAPAYDRVAALPEGSVEVSVAGEWSFAETLRHLVFATDAWLGAARGEEHPFHPWGKAFTEVAEFVDSVDDLGVDFDAAPSYADVLEVRRQRVGQVRDYLVAVTPEELAVEVTGPPWEHGEKLSRLRCLWVILNEELEHLRFAQRDLDLIEAKSPLVGA